MVRTYWRDKSKSPIIRSIQPSNGVLTDETGNHRSRMQQTLQDAVPLVTQAIGSTLTLSMSHQTTPEVAKQFQAAMRCFEAWVPIFPARYFSRSCHALARGLYCQLTLCLIK